MTIAGSIGTRTRGIRAGYRERGGGGQQKNPGKKKMTVAGSIGRGPGGSGGGYRERGGGCIRKILAINKRRSAGRHARSTVIRGTDGGFLLYKKVDATTFIVFHAV